jgi:hypothetical protein
MGGNLTIERHAVKQSAVISSVDESLVRLVYCDNRTEGYSICLREEVIELRLQGGNSPIQHQNLFFQRAI